MSQIQNNEPRDIEIVPIPMLVLRIATRWFALPLALCKEITASRPVIFVPQRSNQLFQGLVHVQGKLFLCISLAHVLALETKEAAPHLILIEKEKEVWSFHVEEIAGVEMFDYVKISTPKAFVAKQMPINKEIKEVTVDILDEEYLFAFLRQAIKPDAK